MLRRSASVAVLAVVRRMESKHRTVSLVDQAAAVRNIPSTVAIPSFDDPVTEYVVMLRHLAIALLAAALFTPRASLANDRSGVQFDVTAMVGFQNVSADNTATVSPGEKDVHASLVVSMFVPPKMQVTHALYHFYFPEGMTRIVDYAPRTRVATAVVGEIDVSKNAATEKHVSLGGSAKFESWVSANAGGGRNQTNATTTHYRVQPPVATVLAAGTTNRERGVYFKLQQTSTETLEGEQQLQLTLRVPAYWRGGYMRLVAQASTVKGALPASSFLVPVFLQGDTEAHQIAGQLLTFERHLLQSIAEHGREIRRAGRPTFAHEISIRDPELPGDWQEQILWRTTGAALPNFAARLPSQVRVATANFHTAKRLAVALGQPPTTHSEPTPSG